MHITTLARFLFGDRKAILSIAGNRHAVWIGLLFVLSAGFAREYDGEDLLHEPWHLLVPLGASLVASLVLFTLAHRIAAEKGLSGRPFLQHYGSFLGLFWMTAPLAWLYALPYERFLAPTDAMQANLATLVLVSAWRILLMTRVLVVLFGYSYLASLCVVMVVADSLAVLATMTMQSRLFELMAGIRATERELFHISTSGFVCSWGVCILPFWLAGLSKAIPGQNLAWQLPTREVSARGSWDLYLVAVLSLVVWLPILPYTQPPQQRKRVIEQFFAQRRYGDLLAELSRHDPGDYPPGWEPPPRMLSRIRGDRDIFLVVEELTRHDYAEWVRELYIDRLVELTGLGGFSRTETENLVALLLRLPERDSIVKRLEAQWHEDYAQDLLKAVDAARKRQERGEDQPQFTPDR